MPPVLVLSLGKPHSTDLLAALQACHQDLNQTSLLQETFYYEAYSHEKVI